MIGRLARLVLLLAALASPSAAQQSSSSTPHGPLRADESVRGWTILSNGEVDDLAVIAAAPSYRINHLELSHEVVMDLNEVRDEKKRALVNRLVDSAHAAGIREVVVWDHALYELSYYPERFRTGPNGTIDLDDPAFWAWLKQDYREMLDRVPAVDGVVLTFIETGARAERQHSRVMSTPQEKLAAVVNAVADVVIGERKLNLYARTFSYTHAEYRAIIGAVDRFRPDVRLLMKETPHDFFLTHPNDCYAGTIARPTVIEFDAAGEFNGQGQIASTWPEYMLGRARDLLKRPHVIGYTARTDRYGGTRLVGHPAEIDLYALKRFVEDPGITRRARQVGVRRGALRQGRGPVRRARVSQCVRHRLEQPVHARHQRREPLASRLRRLHVELRAARERQVDRAAGGARRTRREPRSALLARRGGPDRAAVGQGTERRALERGAVGARQRMDPHRRADGRADAPDGAHREALGGREGAGVAPRDRGGRDASSAPPTIGSCTRCSSGRCSRRGCTRRSHRRTTASACGRAAIRTARPS